MRTRSRSRNTSGLQSVDSDGAAVLSIQRKRVNHRCETCGVRHETLSHGRYCSPSCRQKGYRQRQRLYSGRATVAEIIAELRRMVAEGDKTASNRLISALEGHKALRATGDSTLA
jgi:hypothetical protein